MAAHKNHFLMVMSGSEDGRIFEISKDQITIGRNEDNDVVLRDDLYMKPTHALLVRREGRFFLVSEAPSDPKANITLPIGVDQIFTLGSTEFAIKAK